MTVPSYDDLTPSIPDVAGSETVTQLAIFLRPDLDRPAPPQRHASAPASAERPDTGLYACLRHSAPVTPNPERAPGCQLAALVAVARDFSPRIMRASDREVLLDVSGLGRLIGEPPAIARELRRAIADAGIDANVAIAPTQTMARLIATHASDYPTARFAELPVALLQPLETLPPAINHRDRTRPYETFERWGIATLGDLAALPAADLSSRLGRRGAALQRLARGLDPRPFVPDLDIPRYVGRLELEWPIAELEPLSFVLARLLEPLAVALERADRGAAAIRLDLRMTDRSVHTRLLQLPAAMRDPRVLRTLLLLDLESHPPAALRGVPPSPRRGAGEARGERRHETVLATAGIDVVAIELDPAPARITQFSLLERALPSPETVSTLTARLAALVGESRVGAAVVQDTHRGDAFVMQRFAIGAGVGGFALGATAADGADGADGAHTAGAHAAQGAAGGDTLVLRRQRVPPAIRVRVDQGRPVYVAAPRRGMPQGAAVQAAGPWRTSGEWWVGGSWNRDEWDVELSSGAVCRIYQDRTTERWFLEGIYD